MFRKLSLLFITCCTTSSLWSVELPSDAQRYVKSYESTVDKARKELVGNLNKSLAKALKAADLEGANAIKAKIDELENNAESASGGALPLANGVIAGIQVIGGPNGKVWDNAMPYAMSTSEHTLSCYMRLSAPSRVIFLRPKPSYGCERVILSVDGQSDGKMAKEYMFTLKAEKDVIRIEGIHKGSNDEFNYGPLQYRLTADGEWVDIPTAQLAAK